MALENPDDAIVAIFKALAEKDTAASLAAGRPIYTDTEIVELHYPGSKNWSSHPATAFSHWATDPLTGEQNKITYAERFSRQYQQFKAKMTQTKSGTPLDQIPFLTEARRAELRAQNIYTVEALAGVDGNELKNLGQGGREMKNAAIEYIETARTGAVSAKVQAELDTLRAQNMAMAEDLAALKGAAGAPTENKQVSFDPADEFDGMDLAQLREYITSNTGQAPIGALNTKTLRRMARDCRPEKASAA